MSDSEQGPELLTQIEAAARLEITTRQLRRIPDEFTGRQDDGAYPWPGVRDGYIRWKQHEALKRRVPELEAQRGGLKEAQAAERWAKARMAELQLAQMEGRLVPVQVLEEVVGEAADRIRAGLQAAIGRLAPQVVGIESPREAVVILRPAIAEIIQDLATVVDDLAELEPDDADSDDKAG